MSCRNRKLEEELDVSRRKMKEAEDRIRELTGKLENTAIAQDDFSKLESLTNMVVDQVTAAFEAKQAGLTAEVA